MAKLGEGDDRWIVKEREDGKNVNNWHWSETSLTEWARERLEARLKDVVVREDASGTCKLLCLDSMKGDVTIQSRKQKRFPLCAPPAPYPLPEACLPRSRPSVQLRESNRPMIHAQVRARAHHQVGGAAV